ncbi:hypothetical protein [Alkalibacillus aidingensis]|uniref:hypothetical protein n=1 Tax=Alkalibacillus aidingensis TaxID=2747607 RepID=UPI0016606690|nr:hypothetical protein [Alkalibacillus aidingensis]
MIARILTYLLIGILLVAAVSVAAPEYLGYLWIFFSVVFVVGLGVLAFFYGKRAMVLFKEMKKE